MPRGINSVTLVTWDDLGKDATVPRDPFFNDYKILAEGDSWFSLSGVPTLNLLDALRFNKPTLIVNCAIFGDTIRNMSKLSSDKSFKEALSKRSPYTWDAILLSGGGNDLINKAKSIILPPDKRKTVIRSPSDYCNQEQLTNVMTSIQDGYRKLASYRSDENTPIFVHTYDYPTPRDAAARVLGISTIGPWLYTAFKKAKVPESDWLSLSDYLMDVLANSILALSKGRDKINNFHVIDTRGALTRADLHRKGNSGDWLNEIHPNMHGYIKLAKKIEVALSDVMH